MSIDSLSCGLVLPTIVAVLLAAPVAASEPDLELGEFLAAECTSCHRADMVNDGIPSMFGLPEHIFLERMGQYRDGIRDNEIMRNVAGSLNDEEMAALAAYLRQAVPSN